ncbi:sensor histidine kinase [Mycobacteroides chelonae]|uniref:sensor histidine kinase n=1 Tax=Mycobacteroides chelonae TaxID=1774 RepID=UPI001C2C15EB|nr:HAMP domain-containing sensor histidine kinase [Mycobacteroides chelonae]MBV0920446.1 HAMP domain-containing histidine kinase [Mycobacteroides chelonae]
MRLRGRRAWTLRARLVFAQIVLVMALCVFIGVGILASLHRFLLDQLDSEVANAGVRSAVMFDLGPPPVPLPDYLPQPGGPGPALLGMPGQPTGFVGAIVEDRRVSEAAVITSDGSRMRLSDIAYTQLASVPTTGFITITIDGLGSYRLVSTPTHGLARVIVGLPTSGADRIESSARVRFCIVGALALIVGAIASFLIIRRQLAPLSHVAMAASQVADLELTLGDVNMPTTIVRVDAHDVDTEVGKLSIALNKMLNRIAEALAARHASETRVRQFVADASHELRTPLAAIRGYAELAQRDRDGASAEIAYAMKRVDAEAKRMTGLVEDMLLLARLDTGRSLEMEPVDVSRLVVDAVSDAHIAAPQHHWILSLPEEPVIVTGDAARIHQVLVNLLSNCRIHTPADTSVTISVYLTPGGGVQLSVIDDGPGVPEALQPEIFERFARGDSSRSRRGASSGLGLAIAAAIVNAHRGNITVQSRPGRTAFTVSLPESRSDEDL